jgi:hypothetical protein
LNIEMIEPGQRYSVALEVLASPDGVFFTRHRVTAGTPVPEGGGQSYLVVAGEFCTLELTLGPNGLTVRKLKLLTVKRAHITAVVTPGAEAPDWLPQESTYLIYDGARTAATAIPERFIPLDGMAAERSWPAEDLMPLDRLAVAVGRSVARANETLARSHCEAGVALVSSVTIRVAVDQTDVVQGRVLVNLARPGQEGAGGTSASGNGTGGQGSTTGGSPPQYVELTMTTVPCAPSDTVEQSKPEESPSLRSSTIEQDGGWFRCRG